MEALTAAARGGDAMAALRINLEDFAIGMTWNGAVYESAHYLDTETGEVIFISDGMDEDMIPSDFEDNPRYKRIDTIESRDAFRIMEDFVETVEDAAMAERLATALQRPKPFRRFKDALVDHPAVREAWFVFEREAHREIATAWCAGRGIDVEWT
jgi:hypothetical protein